MRRTLLALLSILALCLLTALPRPVQGADTEPNLDQAFAALARYDLGQPTQALAVVEALVRDCSVKPALRRDLAGRLAGVLRSAAPLGAKNFACKQLARIGDASSVPALAPLLSDEKLSFLARLALERIPDPAAGAALRGALGKVQGKLRIGILDSLGARGEAEAEDVLTPLLTDPDQATAIAAADALGRIDNGGNLNLRDALHTGPPAVKAAVARNLLQIADRLRKQGDRGSAMAVYESVAREPLSAALRRAAAHGIALTYIKQEGAGRLGELLKKDDPDLFRLALYVLQHQPEHEFTAPAIAALPTLSPQRQALLAQSLADRGDRAALPAVLQLARQGATPQVRLAAIAAVGQFGDASAVGPFLEIAAGPPPDLAAAAEAALAQLPAKDVDAALATHVPTGDARQRRVAIVALGQRQATSASAVLMAAVQDADLTLRRAALKALGSTVRLDRLDGLIGLLATTPTADQPAVEDAVLAACLPLVEKDACVGKLLAGYAAADLAGKAARLRILSQLGGPKALEAVRAAAKDVDPGLRDLGLHALCDWASPEAVDDLVAIVRTSTERKYKILALRGQVRLAGSSELTPAARLALCKQAFELADRDDERKLALSAAGNVGTPQALALVLGYLDQPALRNEACAAAVAAGQKLARPQPKLVADAMTRVLAVATQPSVKNQATALLKRTGK